MLSRSSFVLTMLAAAIGAAACKSSPAPASSAPTPSSSADQAGEPSSLLGPALLQWSGRFQAAQQQSGAAAAPRGRNNASGSVVLTAMSKSSMRARIELVAETGTSLYMHWALVTGRCGSDALPVLTVSQFPDIAMSNGRGHVDGEVPLALPTSGGYHVNVFWSNGQDQSDVMTCANLRLEPRKDS